VMPSWLPWFAAVSAEGPPVTFGIANRKVARAVVGGMQPVGDLSAARPHPLEERVRIVHNDVAAEGSRPQRPSVRVVLRAGGAQHDPAAKRPRQLGMMDDLGVAVHHRLLEADDVDQESDQRMCITGAQGRPDLWGRCLVAIGHVAKSGSFGPALT